MGAQWDLRPEGMLKSGRPQGPADRSGQRAAWGRPLKLGSQAPSSVTAGCAYWLLGGQYSGWNVSATNSGKDEPGAQWKGQPRAGCEARSQH